MTKEWHTTKSELDLDLTLSSGLVLSWDLSCQEPEEDQQKIDEWKGFIKDK